VVPRLVDYKKNETPASGSLPFSSFSLHSAAVQLRKKTAGLASSKSLNLDKRDPASFVQD